MLCTPCADYIEAGDGGCNQGCVFSPCVLWLCVYTSQCALLDTVVPCIVVPCLGSAPLFLAVLTCVLLRHISQLFVVQILFLCFSPLAIFLFIGYTVHTSQAPRDPSFKGS